VFPFIYILEKNNISFREDEDPKILWILKQTRYFFVYLGKRKKFEKLTLYNFFVSVY
tara:strand:- start:1790 stop:1960 length:171 start_codon:yes stop_codon:yes gene_type:complete